ncbi:MAG: hypothetical protein LBP62_05785 [Clostridiales bacterium]|jgi:hypothetical protein|nr:hypothetical protein [Clostridiales bacterium]
MVMIRFNVSKLDRQANGIAVTDQSGGVVCVVYETPYGYVANDKDNKAAIGTLNFSRRKAIITIPEDGTFVIGRRPFGLAKFPKESGYSKKGRMRRFKVDLFQDGRLAARVSKNPDAKNAYFLDVWKGTNALRTIFIALALNEFFIRKNS